MDKSDWHDDEEDWSEAGDDDGDDFDPSDAVPCPQCGAELYDDADHCHQCGHWLSEADLRAGSPGRFDSRGVKLVAVGLLVAFLVSLLMFGTIF
jgi:hypothetical protein